MAQDANPRVQSIEQEWKEHASFQRNELISFINFLYNQEFYERARIAYFEFLFKLPNDPLTAEAYYYIGRCYEKLNRLDLALKYYGQSLSEADSGSIVYEAAFLRRTYVNVLKLDWTEVLKLTENSDNPYNMAYRGYAHMNQLDFIEARLAFRAAEARFDNKVYSRRLSPILRALDIVDNLESKSKVKTILAGLIPGGGRAYLKGWESALGAALSTGIVVALATRSFKVDSGNMGFTEPTENWIPDGASYNGEKKPDKRLLPQTLRLKSTGKMILVPAIGVGIGVYIGSIWGAVNDIESENIRLKQRAVSKVSRRYRPERFTDFSEPVFN